MSFLWSSYPREFFLILTCHSNTFYQVILKYIALIILNATYQTTKKTTKRCFKKSFCHKNELCMVHLVLFIFTLHKFRYLKIFLTVILLLSSFTNADFIHTLYSFIQTDDRKPRVSIQ